MAGPWEKYQTPSAPASAGPWTNYAPKEDDAIDAGAKSFASESGPAMRFLQGAGKAVHDFGQGVGQAIGVTSREDVAESRRLDAPLMNTGAAANLGNITGSLGMMAPAVLAGGLSVPAAAAFGAVQGALQPSTSTGETAMNTALSAAGGAGGQKLGNMLASAVQGKVAANAAKNLANMQKLESAKAASALGYVIPPDDLNANLITKTLSGVSGKIKTAQEASARNQPITNDLARKALGLPEGAALTEDALQAIRNNAGNAYKNLRGIGEIVPDAEYGKALDALASTSKGASSSFPGLPGNGVADLVAAMKQPKFSASDAIDATIILREMADKSYRAGDKGVGKVQKAIANELESAMERSLSQSNNPALLKEFQNARKDIAKTYSVQKALNSQTGDVSAVELAKQLKKGKPLSDELEQIAKFGEAFPKASQALKESPKATSPLDWIAGVGTSVGTGNVLPLAMVGGRPAARSLVLSGPVQRSAMKEFGTPISAKLLDNRLAQLLAAPVGVQGGLASAELAR